jgi:hypothetical protein
VIRVRGWGVAAVMWLCACTLTTVQRGHDEHITVPAGRGPISGDLGLAIAQDLGADVTEGDIQGISLSTFSITTTTPGTDVAFFDRVDVYIEAAGLPRILIASGSDFPPGATSVQLDPVDEELSDYLLGENVQVYTIVSGAMPSANTDLDVHMVVDIGVTPKGACNALQGSDSGDEGTPEDTGGTVHSSGSLGG